MDMAQCIQCLSDVAKVYMRVGGPESSTIGHRGH
jgi:hypothetical protein